MNYNENVFVSKTMYSSYGNNTLSIDPRVGLETTFNADRYNDDIKEEKNYIYYKVLDINFQFQKVFKIKLDFVSLHIGDIIDFITKKTGIKKLIIKLTNGNCGCEARRIKFNKWFKIPVIFFKFDKLSYKNEIDLSKIKEFKNQKIDEEKTKSSEEEIIENVKLNMINQRFETYNQYSGAPTMNPNTSPDNKKSGGCGCAAAKQFAKRVKHV
jgi:hypothetical protein